MIKGTRNQRINSSPTYEKATARNREAADLVMEFFLQNDAGPNNSAAAAAVAVEEHAE